MNTTGEFTQLEHLIKGQSEVMQLIIQGKPLEVVLEKLTKWVENQSEEGLIASILCTDDTEKRLFHCAGSRLSPGYIEAINGLTIGPNVGSCGTAAFTRKPVIVENIQESFLWKDFKEIALTNNLYSCWSTPLINSEGKLRGTFAIYYNIPKKPTEKDRQLITLVSDTALLAIEHHFAELTKQKNSEREKRIFENLRKSEERFQSLVREAKVGIVVLKGEEFIIDVANKMYSKLIDKTPEQIIGKPLFKIIPEAEAIYKPLLSEVKNSGNPLYLYDHPYSVIEENKEHKGYLNIIYQPFREMDGSISGITGLVQDVTEVVESRKRLEESEAKFRNLVMQAPVAIAVFKGSDLIAEIANEAYLQTIDRNREEFIGKPLLQSLSEGTDTLLPLVEKIFNTGEAVLANEYPVTLKRGGEKKECFFNGIWQPLLDFNGNVDGFIAVAHEVTQQVESRRKVEESEQQVRSLVESAPFPIGVYVGREMRIQFANQAMKDVWGKGNDVEGKLYAELLPELSDQNIYNQLDEVFTTGIPFHAWYQRVDLIVEGQLQPFYFNYSFTPLFNSRGQVYGVMNTAANVTSLVMANNNLEESEARARLAIEASEQGTFDVNLLTSEIKSSKRLIEIFDVDEDSERHRYISAIHPDDLSLRENAYKKAYETGILEYDARLIKKNGHIIWIRVRGKIYFGENHSPERLVGIVQDISEHKNFAEALARKVQERTEELEEANVQLRAINEELNQFAYVSSHDLQEPLRKIKIYSNLISKKLEHEGGLNDYLKKINASAERMSSLIRSLLEYSQVTNTTPRFEKTDLSELIATILIDYELLIEQKGATVTINGLTEIEGIPLQLNQLFFNLIGNALKFTKKDTPPNISIEGALLTEEKKCMYRELKKDKAYIEIIITDNGIGFENEFASKIFTVFQRLNDRSSFGGYGIGLALCKKVVQTHKGIIYAQGKLMEGARFTVILPLTQNF